MWAFFLRKAEIERSEKQTAERRQRNPDSSGAESRKRKAKSEKNTVLLKAQRSGDSSIPLRCNRNDSYRISHDR